MTREEKAAIILAWVIVAFVLVAGLGHFPWE